MAVTVYVNGTPFAFPETNDTQWGDTVTGWAQAVSAETVQSTGGTFLLTKDLNFGTANGIVVQFLQTPQINATANLLISAPTKIDLNAATVRFLSGGVYYTLQGMLANTGTSFDHANGAFITANAGFDKANSANVTGQAAFDKANVTAQNANTAIYTAAQIRANVSNTAPINYDSSTGIISHAVSGVSATVYGNASFVSQVTVDDKGHVTAVANVAIDTTLAQAAYDKANVALLFAVVFAP